MTPGDVVIVLDTNQAGTVEWVTSTDACVLLRSGEVWVGPIGSVRVDPTADEITATVVEVERRASVKPKRGGKRHE